MQERNVSIKKGEDMARRLEFHISSDYEGKSVREFLKKEADVSARVLRILKNDPQGLSRNGAHIRTIDPLHENDVLTLLLPDDKAVSVSAPTPMPLDILYEDDDLILINKPAGLAMHETHNHQGDALSNALAFYFARQGISAVFRAVGRLDKGTSGVVVCAKNKYCASRLAGAIQKTYLCLVCGKYEGSGTIDAPIIRPDPNKTLRAVGNGGERAVTHWQALKTDGVCTLLRIRLETGRTHQIRVHFAYLGTPLVGDAMYESPDLRLEHQALHCAACAFVHPVTRERLEFHAPMPDDMAALVEAMSDCP